MKSLKEILSTLNEVLATTEEIFGILKTYGVERHVCDVTPIDPPIGPTLFSQLEWVSNKLKKNVNVIESTLLNILD